MSVRCRDVSHPRAVAADRAPFRAARIARRHSRLLCVHRLHRARRDGDRRRRLVFRKPDRRPRARRPHHPRRRRRVLADPSRGERRRTRLPAKPRTGFGRRHHARDGARVGRQACALVEIKAVDGAYPLYGTRSSLDPAMPLADALCRARRRFRRGRRSGLAGAARSAAGRPHHGRRRDLRNPRRACATNPTSSPAASALGRAC